MDSLKNLSSENPATRQKAVKLLLHSLRVSAAKEKKSDKRHQLSSEVFEFGDSLCYDENYALTRVCRGVFSSKNAPLREGSLAALVEILQKLEVEPSATLAYYRTLETKQNPQNEYLLLFAFYLANKQVEPAESVLLFQNVIGAPDFFREALLRFFVYPNEITLEKVFRKKLLKIWQSLETQTPLPPKLLPYLDVFLGFAHRAAQGSHQIHWLVDRPEDLVKALRKPRVFGFILEQINASIEAREDSHQFGDQQLLPYALVQLIGLGCENPADVPKLDSVFLNWRHFYRFHQDTEEKKEAADLKYWFTKVFVQSQFLLQLLGKDLLAHPFYQNVKNLLGRTAHKNWDFLMCYLAFFQTQVFACFCPFQKGVFHNHQAQSWLNFNVQYKEQKGQEYANGLDEALALEKLRSPTFELSDLERLELYQKLHLRGTRVVQHSDKYERFLSLCLLKKNGEAPAYQAWLMVQLTQLIADQSKAKESRTYYDYRMNSYTSEFRLLFQHLTDYTEYNLPYLLKNHADFLEWVLLNLWSLSNLLLEPHDSDVSTIFVSDQVFYLVDTQHFELEAEGFSYEKSEDYQLSMLVKLCSAKFAKLLAKICELDAMFGPKLLKRVCLLGKKPTVDIQGVSRELVDCVQPPAVKKGKSPEWTSLLAAMSLEDDEDLEDWQGCDLSFEELTQKIMLSQSSVREAAIKIWKTLCLQEDIKPLVAELEVVKKADLTVDEDHEHAPGIDFEGQTPEPIEPAQEVGEDDFFSLLLEEGDSMISKISLAKKEEKAAQKKGLARGAQQSFEAQFQVLNLLEIYLQTHADSQKNFEGFLEVLALIFDQLKAMDVKVKDSNIFAHHRENMVRKLKKLLKDFWKLRIFDNFEDYSVAPVHQFLKELLPLVDQRKADLAMMATFFFPYQTEQAHLIMDLFLNFIRRGKNTSSLAFFQELSLAFRQMPDVVEQHLLTAEPSYAFFQSLLFLGSLARKKSFYLGENGLTPHGLGMLQLCLKVCQAKLDVCHQKHQKDVLNLLKACLVLLRRHSQAPSVKGLPEKLEALLEKDPQCVPARQLKNLVNT